MNQTYKVDKYNQQGQRKQIFKLQMNHINSQSIKRSKVKSQYLYFPLPNITTPNPQDINSLMQREQFDKDFERSLQKRNSFVALSELKSAQDQYDMIKKRMQVLRLKDQKNTNRYQLNQRKMMLHDSIQKLASFEKQRIQHWKHETDEKKQQQRIQNLQQKLQHHKNFQNIIETLKENKTREYENGKQQSKSNESKINLMEQYSLNINKSRVGKIKQMEELSRISIDVYNQQKLSTFKDKKFKEIDSFTLKKLQTEQQIKKILKLQMDMIQKQSTSRLIFHQSNQKLKQLLNPQTNLKSSQLSLKSSRIRVDNNKQNQSSFDQRQLTNHSIDLTETRNNDLHNQKQNNKIEIVEISKQNKVDQLESQRSSDSLTKDSSSRMKNIKNGFSLPQIKSGRKYP